jgi:hypothetical protein
MPAAPERSAFERVVVRLGAATRGDPVLEAALRLAAALDAALEGVFVEDPNLLRLAALPFASEVSALTGARRSLDASDVERALRVAASRHERRLAESAARTRVRWTFAVARGDFLGEATARGGDLLVLGAHAGAALGSGPVVAVQDGWPESQRALEAAARLARALGRRLVIVVGGETDAAIRATQHLEAHGLAGSAATTAAKPVALAATLRAQRGVIVVVPAPALAAWSLDPDALAQEIACPLVVAR